jgi:hypothetical protein
MSLSLIQDHQQSLINKLNIKEQIEVIHYQISDITSQTETLAKLGRDLTDNIDGFSEIYDESDKSNLFRIFINNSNAIQDKLSDLDAVLMKMK